jgi:hypothetical protein
MTALANTLELLAQMETLEENVLTLDGFEDLLELANDVYIATLETHVASLEYSRMAG